METYSKTLSRQYATSIDIVARNVHHKTTFPDLNDQSLEAKGAYVCGAEAAERMLQVVATAGVRSHLTSIPFERIPEIVKIYTDDKFQGRIVVDVS